MSNFDIEISEVGPRDGLQNCKTIMPTEDKKVWIKSLYDAGGEDLLIVGTDEPVYTSLLPGFAFHRELLAMVHAGLPPEVVLKAATINGARSITVQRAYVLAFFDRYLRNGNGHLLAGPSRRYPEMRFTP